MDPGLRRDDEEMITNAAQFFTIGSAPSRYWYAMKTYFSKILILLCCLFGTSAHAQSSDMAAVQSWLKGINTVVADFTQTAPNGKSSTGKMQLSRPGNIRFEYEPSVPVLIVAKGGWLSMIDYGVAQVQRYPIKDTPLSVLLDPKADITKLGRVVAGPPDMLVIEAKDPKRPQFGTLNLFFARHGNAPGGLGLSGWIIIDGQGNRTAIQLSNVRANVAVPTSAFTWRDPRPKNISGKGR
jgi:outer membrane lipoprotein-sorting protein